SSRRRHTRSLRDWSSDVCSSDLTTIYPGVSPQEIEKVLTIKIEEAVRDVEGVDKVDSTVIEGMSATRLSLLPGIRNVDRVLQEEIGRASCRERVWVEGVGVGVRR